MIMDQLPLLSSYRVHETEVTHLSLQNAALSLGKLTVRSAQDLEPKRTPKSFSSFVGNDKALAKGRFFRRTMFKEISCFPHKASSEIKKFYPSRLDVGRPVTSKELVSKIVLAVEKTLREVWGLYRVKIVAHSAGYDSRFLSAIISRIKKDTLPEHFGEVYFVCWEPEITEFKEIMKYQGWYDSQIICCNAQSKTGRGYFDAVLDFNYIGRYHPLSSRKWLGPIEGVRELTRRFVFPMSDCLGIAALFFDEVFTAKVRNRLQKPTVKTWGEFVTGFMTDQCSLWNGTGWPSTFPFVSRRMLTLLTDLEFPLFKDAFARLMVEEIDPELAKFPNPREHIKKGVLPYRFLSTDAYEKMSRAFYGSWYCKTFKKRDVILPRVVGPHQPEMVEYMKASICECLLNMGCQLKKGKT